MRTFHLKQQGCALEKRERGTAVQYRLLVDRNIQPQTHRGTRLGISMSYCTIYMYLTLSIHLSLRTSCASDSSGVVKSANSPLIAACCLSHWQEKSKSANTNTIKTKERVETQQWQKGNTREQATKAKHGVEGLRFGACRQNTAQMLMFLRPPPSLLREKMREPVPCHFISSWAGVGVVDVCARVLTRSVRRQ